MTGTVRGTLRTVADMRPGPRLVSGRPTVVVIAKEPVAGRVKTRCTPPCSPSQAAALATAALAETLSAIAAVAGVRRVLALDGRPGCWLPDGFEVIGQRGDGLGERLDRAFADVGAPALLVGHGHTATHDVTARRRPRRRCTIATETSSGWPPTVGSGPSGWPGRSPGCSPRCR